MPFSKLLFFLWQLPQNLVGLLIYLLLRCTGMVISSRKHEGAVFINVRQSQARGGMALGSYLFFFSEASHKLSAHEYGHYIQSRALGPFYLLLVALPSLIRAIMIRTRLISVKNYDAFFIESNATSLGNRFLKSQPCFKANT